MTPSADVSPADSPAEAASDGVASAATASSTASGTISTAFGPASSADATNDAAATAAGISGFGGVAPASGAASVERGFRGAFFAPVEPDARGLRGFVVRGEPFLVAVVARSDEPAEGAAATASSAAATSAGMSGKGGADVPTGDAPRCSC
ncbi:hypothetical protein [Microbacterium sp. SGAir0570]|uniref:hypothetical protein n=1 Tax=Microbacterium sp. SGAir0570 TaxID=2070348 RepID=UPI00215ACFF1|nr:hypothetical protein [Microbacterium sp. SGAir0570]